MSLTGLAEADFCPAAAAAIITLRGEAAKKLATTFCPSSNKVKIDQFDRAISAHHLHVCDCGKVW